MRSEKLPGSPYNQPESDTELLLNWSHLKVSLSWFIPTHTPQIVDKKNMFSSIKSGKNPPIPSPPPKIPQTNPAFFPILEAHDFERQLTRGSTKDELTRDKPSYTHRSKGSTWAHPAPTELNK